MIKIAPSVLSADFASLGAAVSALSHWGADYVHLDVMDGSFVPNITFGAPMCRALRQHSGLVFDAHLMVANPARWVDDFKDAGVDIVTIHIEADHHAHRTLSYIKSLGMRAGIAINPSTPVSAVENVLDVCDIVLIMSVNPGFGGQSFIKSTYEKIANMRSLIDNKSLNTEIQVDGGINIETATLCRENGATVLVAGNSIFNALDPKQMIKALRGQNG